MKQELWPQAYRSQDPVLLGSILHESFQLIGADGERSNRDGEIEFVKNNEWNPAGFSYTIERLDIYDGRYAIVAGTGDADAYSYKSSNVFIKTDKGWKAVASHVSGYVEK
jgi:hypothetical protein